MVMAYRDNEIFVSGLQKISLPIAQKINQEIRTVEEQPSAWAKSGIQQSIRRALIESARLNDVWGTWSELLDDCAGLFHLTGLLDNLLVGFILGDLELALTGDDDATVLVVL